MTGAVLIILGVDAAHSAPLHQAVVGQTGAGCQCFDRIASDVEHTVGGNSPLSLQHSPTPIEASSQLALQSDRYVVQAHTKYSLSLCLVSGQECANATVKLDRGSGRYGKEPGTAKEARATIGKLQRALFHIHRSVVGKLGVVENRYARTGEFAQRAIVDKHKGQAGVVHVGVKLQNAVVVDFKNAAGHVGNDRMTGAVLIILGVDAAHSAPLHQAVVGQTGAGCQCFDRVASDVEHTVGGNSPLSLQHSPTPIEASSQLALQSDRYVVQAHTKYSLSLCLVSGQECANATVKLDRGSGRYGKEPGTAKEARATIGKLQRALFHIHRSVVGKLGVVENRYARTGEFAQRAIVDKHKGQAGVVHVGVKLQNAVVVDFKNAAGHVGNDRMTGAVLIILGVDAAHSAPLHQAVVGQTGAGCQCFDRVASDVEHTVGGNSPLSLQHSPTPIEASSQLALQSDRYVVQAHTKYSLSLCLVSGQECANATVKLDRGSGRYGKEPGTAKEARATIGKLQRALFHIHRSVVGKLGVVENRYARTGEFAQRAIVDKHKGQAGVVHVGVKLQNAVVVDFKNAAGHVGNNRMTGAVLIILGVDAAHSTPLHQAVVGQTGAGRQCFDRIASDVEHTVGGNSPLSLQHSPTPSEASSQLALQSERHVVHAQTEHSLALCLVSRKKCAGATVEFDRGSGSYCKEPGTAKEARATIGKLQRALFHIHRSVVGKLGVVENRYARTGEFAQRAIVDKYKGQAGVVHVGVKLQSAVVVDFKNAAGHVGNDRMTGAVLIILGVDAAHSAPLHQAVVCQTGAGRQCFDRIASDV